jgi:uncharacterized protein (TIGR03382 family)
MILSYREVRNGEINMLSLLIMLLTPNAEACSPAPAEPVWSFPADGSADSALNQPLQVFITNSNFGEIELTVWNSNTDEPIAGSASYSCPVDPNGWDHCLVRYLPDDGFWPSDSVIAWSADPVDEGWGGSLSGSFSTTDWLSAGDLPETMGIEGEMVEWRPIESTCDSTPIIQLTMSIQADSLEDGVLLQVMQETVVVHTEDIDGILPEPLLVAQHLVRDDGKIELSFDIEATEDESCFSVWAFSPDGTNLTQYDGPCLEWGRSNGGNGGGWGCATAPESSPLYLGWFGALFMLMIGRRRKD